MSFHIGAGTWWLVGIILGAWWFNAQRNWINALARHGRVPSSANDLITRGLLRPWRSATTLAAIARESYPTTRASEYEDVERWRLRRKRRRTAFLVWVFGGLPIGLALIASVEVVQETPLLAVLYVPLGAVAFLVARTVRSYGNVEPHALSD